MSQDDPIDTLKLTLLENCIAKRRFVLVVDTSVEQQRAFLALLNGGNVTSQGFFQSVASFYETRNVTKDTVFFVIREVDKGTVPAVTKTSVMLADQFVTAVSDACFGSVSSARAWRETISEASHLPSFMINLLMCMIKSSRVREYFPALAYMWDIGIERRQPNAPLPTNYLLVLSAAAALVPIETMYTGPPPDASLLYSDVVDAYLDAKDVVFSSMFYGLVKRGNVPPHAKAAVDAIDAALEHDNAFMFSSMYSHSDILSNRMHTIQNSNSTLLDSIAVLAPSFQNAGSLSVAAKETAPQQNYVMNPILLAEKKMQSPRDIIDVQKWLSKLMHGSQPPEDVSELANAWVDDSKKKPVVGCGASEYTCYSTSYQVHPHDFASVENPTKSSHNILAACILRASFDDSDIRHSLMIRCQFHFERTALLFWPNWMMETFKAYITPVMMLTLRLPFYAGRRFLQFPTIMKTLACDNLSIQMRHFLLVSVFCVFAFGPTFSGDGIEFLKTSNPTIYNNPEKVRHLIFTSVPSTVMRLFNIANKTPAEIARTVDMNLLRRACLIACGGVRLKCIDKAVVADVLSTGMKSMTNADAKSRLQSRIDMVNAALDRYSADFMLWPSTLETLSLVINKTKNFSLTTKVLMAFAFECDNCDAALPHAGQSLSDVIPTNAEMTEMSKTASFQRKSSQTDASAPPPQPKHDMRPLAVLLNLLENDYFGYDQSCASAFVEEFMSSLGDACVTSRLPSLVLVNTANRTVVFPNELLVLPHDANIDGPDAVDGIPRGVYDGFDADLLVLLENHRIDQKCRKNIETYLASVKDNPQAVRQPQRQQQQQQTQPPRRNIVKK